MIQKTLIALALIYPASDAFSLDDQRLEAARQKFERAGGTEEARQQYVNELAEMLGHETSDHIANGSHNDDQLDKLEEELKRHPAPENADSKKLTELRVGKWQATRHASIYRANGTWRMAPESGTTSGRWRIEGNRYIQGWNDNKGDAGSDEATYTIIALTNKDFVFTDGRYVFYEYRVGK